MTRNRSALQPSGISDVALATTRVVQEFDSRYGLRDTVRIEVTDADGNTQAGTAENVVATAGNSRSGEVETLLLVETDLDTGVFQVRVEIVMDPPANGDNKLSVLSADQLSSTMTI